MLAVSQDIQLVQRFREVGLSGRSEAMVLHFANELDPEGDVACPGDEEVESWSASE